MIKLWRVSRPPFSSYLIRKSSRFQGSRFPRSKFSISRNPWQKMSRPHSLPAYGIYAALTWQMSKDSPHCTYTYRKMSEPPEALIVITLMGYNPNKKSTINLRLKKNWIGPVTHAIAARLQNQEHNLELLACLSYLEMCVCDVSVEFVLDVKFTTIKLLEDEMFFPRDYWFRDIQIRRRI